MSIVQTVTGPVEVVSLGKTLMHEHLTIGYPGASSDTISRRDRSDLVARCVDKISELQALGYTTLIDPCPNDLGRDIELTIEVAETTGFNIVFATGLYKEDQGGAAYWNFRNQFADVTSAMTELFVAELTEGVPGYGVKPGVIKTGTGLGQMTDHERRVFDAAAAASIETGVGITTHTEDGTVGDLQQQVLVEAGVNPAHVVIGHSCGSSDPEYHRRIADGGSFLGFDRFGLEVLHPDAERVEALVALVGSGAGDQVVVSHDSVWCWQGQPFPKGLEDSLEAMFDPTHYDRVIVPLLLEAGLDQAQLDAFVIDNPRRFFSRKP
ncbi:MAG: phosphotriesterase [Acidobacteria bacterium]|nr:phosphotriesterase [Acidobacteriota bacterium]